jgi:hypothetical protein
MRLEMVSLSASTRADDGSAGTSTGRARHKHQHGLAAGVSAERLMTIRRKLSNTKDL